MLRVLYLFVVVDVSIGEISAIIEVLLSFCLWFSLSFFPANAMFFLAFVTHLSDCTTTKLIRVNAKLDAILPVILAVGMDAI